MAKTSRSAPKNKPPAAPVPLSSGTTKPSPPARRAPQPTNASPLGIEEQVDTLLDKAQEQVQTMAELTNEPESNGDSPAPATSAQPEAADPDVKPASPPSPAAGGGESPEALPAAGAEGAADEGDESSAPDPAGAADDPIDPAVLQSQVDAILAEAGYPVGEPVADEAAAPTGDDREQTPPTSEADEEDDPPQDEVKADEPTVPVDLSEVDAVIADAAQRAMEEDEFDPTADEASDAVIAAASPAGGAASAPTGAAAPARPKAVKKGGDASMRRENRVRSAPDADLDGDFANPAPLTAAGDDEADGSMKEAGEAVASGAVGSEAGAGAGSAESPPQGVVELIQHHAIRTLALANSPWHTWSVFTRYAVLALTIGNGLLALVAFVVVLRRLW